MPNKITEEEIKEAYEGGRHQAVLVGDHASRLGVDFEEAQVNLKYFAEQVGMIENDGKTAGKNIPQKGKEATTASGLFQFVEDSVEPALNRLEKYVGVQPWMEEVRESKDAGTLSREEQTLLFFGDMLEKKGSDKYMKGVMEGDKEMMLEAYLKLHHTKPDMATRNRARKYLL